MLQWKFQIYIVFTEKSNKTIINPNSWKNPSIEEVTENLNKIIAIQVDLEKLQQFENTVFKYHCKPKY